MYQVICFEKDEYLITTDYHKIDIEKVINLLKNSYWAKTRSDDTISKSLKNSLCFSMFYQNSQIGLLRVITDYSTFAYLCDFIIDENFQHQGLGKWCLECMLNHPDLINIKRWFLITKDAHKLYEKYGFNKLKLPDIYMEMNK